MRMPQDIGGNYSRQCIIIQELPVSGRKGGDKWGFERLFDVCSCLLGMDITQKRSTKAVFPWILEKREPIANTNYRDILSV